MKKMRYKKICNKNGTCYYLDDTIKFKDIDFDKVLKNEKSHENILI